MAIATDSYYDIINGGITLDRIGLSKTLDNYSIDDIKAMTFCGATEDKVYYMGKGEPEGSNDTMVGYTQNVSGGCPYIARYIGSQFQYPQLDIGGTDEYNYPDGLNHTVLWLYRSSGTYDGVITPTNQINYKVITEWDAPKYTMYITYDNSKSNIFLIEDNISVVYNTNRGSASNVQVNAIGVPYIIFEHDGKVFFMHAFYFTLLNTTSFTYINNSNNSSCMCAFRSYTDAEEYGTAVTMADLCNGDNLDNPAVLPAQVSVVNHYNYTGHTMVDGVGAYVTVGSRTGLGVRGISMRYFYTKLESMLLNIAGAGLYFNVRNTEYKPIISSGWVIDYTDDLEKQSDIDGWSGSTQHTVPPSPPGPTPPSADDDIDSMGFDGMSCNVGGPARYYIMSYSDIHHLIGDFNAHAEPGTSISNNIISCYVNALDWNWSTGSEPIEIYSGGAQTTAFTSDINYSVLTGYNARDIIGSIDVPRMTNTFYDFSPYSTYEVYVPFCGWVALPDTVAGRNIKVYFETDEATCGCKGRIFFVDGSGNGVTIAEITGSFGAPCPIQVIEGGLYKQAMLSNGLQVIGGIASGIMGGASGAGVLAVSGLSNAMQGLGNCLVAGNTNYGQTIGRAGDASGLMCAGKPYLKITYPPIDEVVNNNMFAHTVGYLCNTIGKLSNFHGFTVCANPHIHISATSTEKEEIKRLLEEGVILP